MEDRAIVRDDLGGETFSVPVILLESINQQGEPVAAQDAITTESRDEMEHPSEDVETEPQIDAANVSPLLMSRLLGLGRQRTAPIQLGEGHQASARASMQSEDQSNYIWSFRDHASPGRDRRRPKYSNIFNRFFSYISVETPSYDSLSVASEDPRIRRDFASNVNTDEENSMDFQPMPSSVPDLTSTLTIDLNDLNGNDGEENLTGDPNNSGIGGISGDDMNESCRSNAKES